MPSWSSKLWMEEERDERRGSILVLSSTFGEVLQLEAMRPTTLRTSLKQASDRSEGDTRVVQLFEEKREGRR